MRFNEGKCKVLPLRSGQPQAQTQTGRKMDWEKPWGGLWGVGGWEAQRVPAVCSGSPGTKCVLGCTQCPMGSRAREGIVPPALPLWGPTWGPAASSGAPKARKMLTCQRRPQSWSRGWSISAMETDGVGAVHPGGTWFPLAVGKPYSTL